MNPYSSLLVGNKLRTTNQFRKRNIPKLPSGPVCPSCASRISSVIDCRKSYDNVRRRRECECGYRYTTMEAIVSEDLIDFQI